MDVTRIPGLLADLVLYILTVMPTYLPTVLSLSTPIALGALCGVLCERSGVVNIGIEGIMLTSAFAGYVTGFALHESIGDLPALILGVAVAVIVGLVLGVVHGWLCITVRADQIIAGVFLNIAALGVTGYLNRLIVSPSGKGGAGLLPQAVLPEQITNLPLIGPVLAMFFNQGPIAMSVLFIVIALQFLLFRSRWGLRTRAVGEHPKAADTVGIDVLALRYRNVIIGCGLAGLAGAFIILESTGTFSNGMTNGRGFIALAAVIFGRWTPVGAFLGALLFGFVSALQTMVGVAPPSGDLGAIMGQIPNQWYAALPYVVTIVVLAGVVGRSTPPAADGVPYEKEARA